MISAFGIEHELSKSYLGNGMYQPITRMHPTRRALVREEVGRAQHRRMFGDKRLGLGPESFRRNGELKMHATPVNRGKFMADSYANRSREDRTLRAMQRVSEL